jgi:hypothetical protein
MRSMKDLEGLLNGTTWAATVKAMTDVTGRIVVEDMGHTVTRTRSIILAGPEELANTAKGEEPDAEYCQARIAGGRMVLPSPFAVQPIGWDHTIEGAGADRIRRLESALQGATQRLVWYWLATSAEIDADGTLTATFSGARVVSLEIKPQPSDSALSEIELYKWASSGISPARDESVQQAISLAVVIPTDLSTAARPALRTAKLLFGLAQRGVVAEAMGARRAARAAAAESARRTAQAARDAAGKAVDRALLQVVAAAGIVLSEASNLINQRFALILLSVVVVLALGSLIVALHVELPSARGGLEAELADLGQYRDTLSSDEIEGVSRGEAVTAAGTDLRRARLTVIIVYSLAILMLAAAGSALVLKARVVGETPPSPAITPGASASTSGITP